MPSVQNITNIPAPRVEFIDPRTGLMSREWYRFFLNLFVLTGNGSNATSLEDLQLGPAFEFTSDMFVVDNTSTNAESSVATLEMAVLNLKQALETQFAAAPAIAALEMAVLDLKQALQTLPSTDSAIAALAKLVADIEQNLQLQSANANYINYGDVGSFSSLAYSTTLTGGTGIVNLGSGQFYKAANGDVGVGTALPFAGGLMTVRSGTARYSLGDTSQAVDKKYWDMVSTGGAFYMRSLDDTSSNSTAFLTAERGGTGTNWVVSAVTLNTAGGERMRVDSSGNVMIGTVTSPTVSRLYINSAESRIQSRNTTSGANGYSGSLATNEYRGAWAVTNTVVTFGSNDVERFRLDTGGNLLITSIGGLGYGTGSGGAVTQLISRATGVTLDKTNGAITMFSAAGSATAATFTVTNSKVAATDVVHVSVKSATNIYLVFVTATAAGSFNITFQTTGGTAVDAPVINFAVIKAVTA